MGAKVFSFIQFSLRSLHHCFKSIAAEAQRVQSFFPLSSFLCVLCASAVKNIAVKAQRVQRFFPLSSFLCVLCPSAVKNIAVNGQRAQRVFFILYSLFFILFHYCPIKN